MARATRRAGGVSHRFLAANRGLTPPARLLLLLVLVITGCRRPAPAPPPPDPWFEDFTDRLNLRFTHDAGPLDGRYFLPQIVGSGGAFLDFDGDGRLDVYLVHNGRPQGK